MKITCNEKMSKNNRRGYSARRRTLWTDFGINSPVTKVIPDKKKENKKCRCRMKKEPIPE